MGIGKDSANFVTRGIIALIRTVFIFGLLFLIGYLGYKFLSANYATHPNYGVMLVGLVIGDFVFCTIVEKYIVQVLLKGR